ncbi:MAG: hypothetical protein ABR502_01700 [Chitinophagaceae bacterium]
MLKELFELVKANAAEPVINNPDIPNEKNNEVVAEATNTVASGLRNIVAGGGVQSLVSLLNSGNRDKKSLLSNPIVSMMMGHFAGKLMNKFNLNNNQANNVSGSLIPNILSSLINKTNDPSDQAFSLEKILGSITGNKSGLSQGGSLQDLLSQLSGGGTQGAGGGMLDIIKSLAGGAQQQQQTNGDKLLDIIKGFAR